MRGNVAGDGPAILDALNKKASADSWQQDRIGDMQAQARREARALGRSGGGSSSGAGGSGVDEDDDMAVNTGSGGAATRPSSQRVDLESLEFAKGSHTMTNKRCELPDQSWRAQKKGYEEVHVPAIRALPYIEGKSLVDISSLPSWAQPVFKGMEKLNRVQSRLHRPALYSPENLLLCAPTGAGKTNVAMLTILHELGKAKQEDGSFDLDSFKIVYVAPMKALVQETVSNFSQVGCLCVSAFVRCPLCITSLLLHCLLPPLTLSLPPLTLSPSGWRPSGCRCGSCRETRP